MKENAYSGNDIIEAVRKGNEKVIREFYIDNRDDFIRYCKMNFYISTDASGELYQETFLIFIKNCKNGKLTKLTNKPIYYLKAVAKNIFLKERRDKPSNHSHDLIDILHEPNNEKTKDLFRFQQIVIESLEKLQDPCRTLIKEYYYLKTPYSELVDKLNYKNVATIKSKKHQCLKKLKTIIAEEVKKRGL